MAIPKLEKDLANISKLDDNPNDVGGLEPNELKAEFDQAGLDIKEYINQELLPYLEGIQAAASLGIQTISGMSDAKTIQEALEALKLAIDNTATGAIPDASLAGSKLVSEAITSREIAAAAVRGAHIADDSVPGEKLEDNSVAGEKLEDESLESRHYGKTSIKDEHIADLTITGGKVKDGTLTAKKFAAGSVQTTAIADDTVTHDKLANDAKPIYFTNVPIPQTLWQKDENSAYAAEGYTYKAVIYDSRITENHFVECVPEIKVIHCGALCIVVNSFNGGFEIYAKYALEDFVFYTVVATPCGNSLEME